MAGIVEILSALLTPMIAVVTAYIAVQQYRLSKYKLRYELFERRMAVFKSVMEYISVITVESARADAAASKMIRDTAEAYFLFQEDVNDHIQMLYAKGIDLWAFNEALKDTTLTKNERRKRVNERSDLKKWFSEQFAVTSEKFRKYLAVDS